MGCAFGKPSSTTHSFNQKRLDKLEKERGFIGNELLRQGGENTNENNKKRIIASNDDTTNNDNNRNGLFGKDVQEKKVVKKIGLDEYVRGWPKWLVDNIPEEVLAGLVPKSADSYDKLDKIGQGTYSNVYKARERETGKVVALKKVRFDTSEPESIQFMAREIMILQKLDHPNIIKLQGIATSRMQYSLYLVFDFMLSDLTRIITCPGLRLTHPQIKCYMHQLLLGLQHCHERGILHRDIKASNLLIDKNGTLKIADFGLANVFNPKPKRPLTNKVVTLWYRAPELLLGSTDYGVGIDLWSAGCLLAEMFVGRPIMPGRTEVEQLHRIFKLCGSPSEDYWKIMRLSTSFRPPLSYKPSFQEAFRDFPESSFGLLTTLLALNPAYRGTAASALQSYFFSASPLACELADLPVVYREEDDPTQASDKKRRKRSKKHYPKDGHRRSLSKQHKEDIESYKEEESNLSGQETENSNHSNPSSVKAVREEESLSRPSFSPVRPFRQTKAASSIIRTEAHPNASKNIQNFTLLQASITDIINHNNNGNNAGRGNACRRSLSTLDFRALDPNKINKLFGLDN